MPFIVGLLAAVFGSFWAFLGSFVIKLLKGPLVFLLFGPLFKISERIAMFILGKVAGELGSVGLVADNLMGWFILCLRLQDCVTALITFLVMGFTLALVKKIVL